VELIEVIHKRRSVRDYMDIAIDPSTIQSLVDAAIQAPSAMNRQPWEFCVFLDRKRIDDLSRRVKEWLRDNMKEVPSALHRMLSDPEFAPLHHAPALLLVVSKFADNQAVEDCCLAAETLMLAARDAGIGTCWIGLSRPWFELPSTKLELGLAETNHVVAPIILGHPRAWPDSHERNPAEIHWIH
jgi:nitroreductase